MSTSGEASAILQPPLPADKVLILGRSKSNFHFAAKFKPTLELVTFDAISNEVFSPVDIRWDEDHKVDVAFYAAVIFGMHKAEQNRSAMGYFREQAHKIGYTLYQNKVIDLGELTAQRRRRS